MFLTEERLREILRKVEGVTDIQIWREGSKFIAVVISPAFEGVEDHIRQEELWGLLIDNLTDDEHGQVGFVFTHTPQEKAQIDRDAVSGT